MSVEIRIAIVFLLPFFLVLGCQELPGTAKVTRVIDGDTIVVEGGYHVRYIGIDAPEKDEPYYLEAKQANEEVLEDRVVRLEKDASDEDKYGRLLRFVFVDGTFVNAELVRQGYAWAEAYPPDIKYQVFLEAVEKEARQMKWGIWKDQ